MNEELANDKGAQGNADAAGGGTGEGAGAQNTPAVKSWLDGLPDDLKSNETIKAFKGPQELAKALLDTKAKLPVVPESADKYEVAVPEGHPKDDNFINWFKDTALQAGLTQNQAAILNKGYVDLQAAMLKQFAEDDKKAVDALRKEWGNDYDRNLAVADKAVKQFMSAGDVKYVESMGWHVNPVFNRMMFQIGKAVSEDTLREGNPQSSCVRRDAAGNAVMEFPDMRKG